MFDGHDTDFDHVMSQASETLADAESDADVWNAHRLVAEALQLRPNAAAAWLIKSQIESALEDDFSALAAVRVARTLDPTSAFATYIEATVLADLDRTEEAIALLEKAQSLLGEDDDWLAEDICFEHAAALENLGRSQAATDVILAGLDKFPRSELLKSGLEPLRRERARERFRVIRGGRN